MSECFAIFATNGYVIATVRGDDVVLPSYKEIPFKRTIARLFQDIDNGEAEVEVHWSDCEVVSVRLHFPPGRRMTSFLRKQAKRLASQFEFFNLAENMPVFQVRKELCKLC